jgi:hypothetical protein
MNGKGRGRGRGRGTPTSSDAAQAIISSMLASEKRPTAEREATGCSPKADRVEPGQFDDPPNMAKNTAKSHKKKQSEKWWHKMSDCDPISLEPLSELAYPPFELANDENGRALRYFDGQVMKRSHHQNTAVLSCFHSPPQGPSSVYCINWSLREPVEPQISSLR